MWSSVTLEVTFTLSKQDYKSASSTYPPRNLHSSQPASLTNFHLSTTKDKTRSCPKLRRTIFMKLTIISFSKKNHPKTKAHQQQIEPNTLPKEWIHYAPGFIYPHLELSPFSRFCLFGVYSTSEYQISIHLIENKNP